MDSFFSKHIFKVILAVSFIFLFALITLLFFSNNITNKRLDSCIEDNRNNNVYYNKEISSKDALIDKLKQVASTSEEQHQGYIEFTSKNKRLKFLYNKEWICKEMVTDYRVDCYPLSRQEEEYDMGLDQTGVYFADLTMFFDSCELNSDQIIDSSPQKIVREDVGTFFHFYKNFNGCGLTVMAQNPEINTEKKLYNIIH